MTVKFMQYLPPKHVFYNTEMFADAGVDVPETYDDLLAACETLQSKGYIRLRMRRNSMVFINVCCVISRDRENADLDAIKSR